MAQNNWQRCEKCQVLFYAGDAVSVCPAGGAHVNAPLRGNSLVMLEEQYDMNVPGTLFHDDDRGQGCAVWARVVSSDSVGVFGALAPDNFGDVVPTRVGPAGVGGLNFGMSSGAGVAGVSGDATGVSGTSVSGTGVTGTSSEGSGIAGTSTSGTGVLGKSSSGRAVWGVSDTFIATVGDTVSGTGVWGATQTGTGVVGFAQGGGAGPDLDLTAATGVLGRSNAPNGRGVWGLSDSSMAAVGDSVTGTGVWGHSGSGPGVVALSDSGRGIQAKGNPAGHFEGDVEITGDVRLLNADCAEEFQTSGDNGIEPGAVVVIDDSGCLRLSDVAYDKRVAGVVAGAGGAQPAMILNSGPAAPGRFPVALIGQVFCKADASEHPIAVGDLLTTSRRPGHAMPAHDPVRAFGAVIGKALRPLSAGQGLIPILVALQ